MTYVHQYHSPLGTIYLLSDGKSLTGLSFKVPANLASMKTKQNLPIFERTCEWLDIYFQGQDPGFKPQYKLTGLTPFRKRVTEIMETIPYGETITYGEIARQLAPERGVVKMSPQAVGGAVGMNPICLIIPCHRVMGSAGKMTGYSGGVERKVQLLKLEGHNII